MGTHTTIYSKIPNALFERLQHFKDQQEFKPSTSELVRIALERYLDHREHIRKGVEPTGR